MSTPVAPYTYLARPARVAQEFRVHSNGRRGAANTRYVVAFADGASPESTTVNAGEFNGKASCNCCGKRIARCACEFIGCAVVTRSGERVYDHPDGQCQLRCRDQKGAR